MILIQIAHCIVPWSPPDLNSSFLIWNYDQLRVAHPPGGRVHVLAKGKLAAYVNIVSMRNTTTPIDLLLLLLA